MSHVTYPQSHPTFSNFKWKLLTEDHKRSPNDEKIYQNKQVALLGLGLSFKKHMFAFFKDFRPQCTLGKMYIRHLFRNRGFQSTTPFGRGVFKNMRKANSSPTQKQIWKRWGWRLIKYFDTFLHFIEGMAKENEPINFERES